MNLKKTLLILFSLLFIFLSPVYSAEGKVNYGKPLLKVVILDVWQGDSILIITPKGKVVLIDAGMGGSEYMKFDAGKMVIYPYFKKHRINKIDYLVMTHPHSDHIGGLPYLLNKIKVNKCYDCGMPYTSGLYMNCLEIISEKKIKYVIPSGPATLKWDPYLKVKLIHPPKKWDYSDNPNNNSLSLKISYKKISFLFTGDIEEEVEEDILSSGQDLESTFLKVGHHGSDTSSSVNFIEAVNPKVAFVCVGKNNKFGHPSASVISRFTERGIKVFRTDYNGDISIITDGENYEIKTERKVSKDQK
ncbi:MAG: MBL fold metallo-hydrolase [Spirochaetes bacterium]|nr:MBL fold metallo-hydrolase [Spirochaetota bacterium]